MIKVGINGFGRIGRCVVRALQASPRKDEIEIVHINDLCDAKLSAHLLKYDTTHGAFPGAVAAAGEDKLSVAGKDIGYSQLRDATKLPWGDLGVDVVMECTGIFASKDKAQVHLDAGGKRVLISAPAKEVDLTVCYGINHEKITAEHKIISNASCTTNCLAPPVKAIQDAIGIETGWMSTVHAYTNDQVTLDGPHSDFRRARAAAESIIPTKTGAAAAIGLVMPELNGKMSGIALRVPVRNVSLVDLTFLAARATSVDEINGAVTKAAEGPLKGILAICDEPLVSSDFNGNSASSIFEVAQTSVDASGKHAKILTWYDNEWGFSNRMLDTTTALAATL